MKNFRPGPHDFEIPLTNSDGKCEKLILLLHPSQIRLLDFVRRLCNSDKFRTEDICRWCLSWACLAIIEERVDPLTAIKARYILQVDEEADKETEYLLSKFSRLLADGEKSDARLFLDDLYYKCAQEPNPYLRNRYLAPICAAYEQITLEMEEGSAR